MKEVLDRLQVLSLPGTPERDELVSEQLPAAFMADLSAALVTAHHREAWPSTANVVIFLEGFEGLERTSRETATRLLQGLTTQQRQQGRTDPLLLVVASRDPLLEVEEERAAVPFARTDEDAAQQRANSVLKDWKQRAAAAEGSLGLSDLYLPLRLHDFGREETRTYLEQFGERRHTRAFAESLQLVETIDQFTHGHPLFLALAAETVLAAKKGGPQLLPSDFERATVSPAIDPAHSRDQIGAYLVARFLRQLSEEERNDLISCAIPRFVDRKLLRVLLPVLDDRAASKRWDNYRRLSFMTADPVDVERSLFHPVVRQELLNEWPDKDNPASDYSQSHARLRDHFKKRASLGDDRAAVEEAYHALALGDPEPAITVGIRGQRSNLPLWDSLMEAVRQAPTEQLPSHIRGQTDAALTRVRQFPLEDAVRTIVLDTWLLSAPGGDPKGRGDLQRQLGEAYYSLPGGDLGENRRQGVRHLEAALEIFNPEAFPAERARTQSSLGAAYLALWMSSTHDRDVYWGKAISCIQAAAQAFKPLRGRLAGGHPGSPRHPSRGLSGRVVHDAHQPGECLPRPAHRRPRSQPAPGHRPLRGRPADRHPRGVHRRVGHDPDEPG